MSDVQSMSKRAAARRWQFSLASLLGVMLFASLVLGMLANTASQYELVIEAGVLPLNDEALAAWIGRELKTSQVSIERTDRSVHAKFSHAGFLGRARFVMPPLANFGYSEVQRVGWNMTSSSPLTRLIDWLAGLPWRAAAPWLAWAAVAVLMIAGFLARCLRLKRTSKLQGPT